jgi:type II secretory pathway component GspD/PulD (secretin)
MIWAVLTMTALLFSCAALQSPSGDDLKVSFVRQMSVAKAMEMTKQREVLEQSGRRRGVSVPGSQVKVDLKGLNVNDLIDMVFGELLGYPYVVEQSIRDLNKSVDVSIKRKMKKSELSLVAMKALEKLGLHVEDQGGVLYVFAKDEKIAKRSRSVVHVRLLHVSALDVIKAVEAHIGKDEDVRVSDDGKRSVVISGESEAVGRLSRIAKALDIEQRRLMARVQIYELTLTGDFKYGLEAFIRATLGNTFALVSIESKNPATGYRAALTASSDLLIALDLLEKRGVVRIVSKPSFLCHDGKLSQFNVGSDIPIIQGERSTLETQNLYRSIEYRKTGINISLTPVVLSPAEIMLDVNVEISKGEQTTTSSIDSPTILKRSFKSVVKMASGSTVMIAGLIQSEADNSSSTVPGLGEWSTVIGSRSVSSSKTELIILITPVLLENDEESIPDEFLSKIEGVKR